ncbi:MAG: TIGR03364 family FAD-dependent oxidoreductase [Planctomycetales bacterium]|nr:TIGR03364 family FAD-dependent oxidoreductase [Planctomycetales bacterium]
MNERIAVVGAGIAGLAHAWAAARRGAKVVVVERSPASCGASIRNFGMVWPIGQPAGNRYETALRSRALWIEFLNDAGIWHNPCGSLHVAHREQEWAVLSEFNDRAPQLGYECQLLDAEQVLERSPAANSEGLLGGLWSPTEVCVDPRQVIRLMPQWLNSKYQVQFCFDTTVDEIRLPQVSATDGRTWEVDRVLVASGADFQTLYPETIRKAGLGHCKLQMLRTRPQPDNWQLGPMIASGLTLRHYPTFAVCDSLFRLKDRIEAESPELNRFGIHVMVSQHGSGELVLGDSHEYGRAIEPFDKVEIDELILQELRRIVNFPDWTIAQRWHGVYPVLEDEILFVEEPDPGVKLAIAVGGCGMTMSFGLADALWEQWLGSVQIRQGTPA